MSEQHDAPRTSAHDDPGEKIQTGTREFRSAAVGLFLVSAAMFSELYCTQGILPQIAQGLGVSAGDSQLTIVATTGGLAVGVIPVSLLSERKGRRSALLASAALAVLAGVLMPFCHTFAELVALKGLQGFLLAGVSAVTLAYVGEEFHSRAVTPALGMYMAGVAFGGLLGRMLPVWVAAGTGSWRWALGAAAGLAVVCTAVFVATLPRSKFFTPSVLSYAGEARIFLSHLANLRLLTACLLVFCFMGAYVSVYNGLPFRMESPPFDMSPSLYSAFFFVNLVGVFASRKAGTAVAEIGLRRTLVFASLVMLVGILLLAQPAVWLIVLGTVLLTGGGFAGQTCLAGSTAKIAVRGRAQAAALYMASSYGGSAVAGLVGSRIFARSDWDGLVIYVAVLMLLALGLVFTIRDKTDSRSA